MARYRIGAGFLGAAAAGIVLSATAVAGQATEPARTLPPVNALVPNFYYEDLAAAREWYVDRLGFPVVVDIGWVVIVEIAPGRQLALVDGEKGTLSPTDEKGVLLVIETDALEEWYQYIRDIEGIDWYQYGIGFREGVSLKHGILDHPQIEEFRIVDPEGYILEFFRWKDGYRP